MNKIAAYLFILLAVPFAELLIYDGAFVFRFKRKNRFALRFSVYLLCAAAAFLGTSAAVFALCTSVWSFLDPKTMGWMSVALNFIVFFVDIVFFFLCFDEKPMRLLYAAIAGKAAHEIFSCIYAVLLFATDSPAVYVAILDGADAWSVVFYFAAHAAVLAATVAAFALPFSRLEKQFDKTLGKYTLVLFFSIICIVMIARNSAVLGTQDKTVIILFDAVLTVFCLTMLLVERFMLIWVVDREERAAAESRFESYRRQAEFTEESIRTINVKCHDLKHQIRGMLAGKLDEDYIKEVNDAIAIYDANIRTGNAALDTLLTERSLRCEVDGIELTVMLDGGALGFMSTADVNSFFGNALDNAATAVLAEEKENRFIRISSAQRAGLLTVRIENYCSRAVDTDADGLPVTTKPDKSEHGFGTRSMRDVARKYGGEVDFACGDGLFVATAVFPSGNDKKSG